MPESACYWFNDFLKGINASFGSMDFVTLRPFHWFELPPLYSQEWVDWLAETADAREKKGIDYDELAGCLTPGPLRCQLYIALLDFKHARMPKKERLRIAEFFKKLLFAQATDDPFVLKGKNVVCSQAEVNALLAEKRFARASPSSVRAVGRVYSSASHLVNGLYGDIYTDYGLEAFGPYGAAARFGARSILAVKESRDLRQPEVWSQTRSVEADEVKIYQVYSKIGFSVDAISAHFNYDGNAATALTHWAVEADGKTLDEDELVALNEDLEAQAVAQWNRAQRLSFEEMKQKGLEQRCYGFRKLRAALGLGWRPTRAMREAVRGKSFEPKRFFAFPKKNKAAAQFVYWRKVFDPRVDFYPK